MSSVQWSNGFRADLDAIGDFCRERRLWFVVDGIQQLGAFPIDVGRTPIDILVTGGHKWLNAPFGAGFMYINPDVRDRLRPPVAGYLSVDPPEGGWAEYFRTPAITPLQPVTFTPDARRYETGGTGNYPGMVGLAASLDLINSLGSDVIAGHIVGLTDQLLEGLSGLPVRVVTPREAPCRSGIVTFTLGRRGAGGGAHRAAARRAHHGVAPLHLRRRRRARLLSLLQCGGRCGAIARGDRRVAQRVRASSVTRSFHPRAQWSGASRLDSSSGNAK